MFNEYALCQCSSSVFHDHAVPQNLPEVTTRRLVNFTAAIAQKWLPVAHALGVGEKAGSLVGSEKSAEHKCLLIFEYWIQKGVDCTWKNLIAVLCQHGLNLVAKNICESFEDTDDLL